MLDNEDILVALEEGDFRVEYTMSDDESRILDECSFLLYVEGFQEVDSLTLKELDKRPVCSLLTPNGDGVNDVFVINEVDSYPDNELVVFDRLGSLVFRSRSYKNDWNGMNGNKRSLNVKSALPVGTYFYLFLSQNEKIFSGYIELAY